MKRSTLPVGFLVMLLAMFPRIAQGQVLLVSNNSLNNVMRYDATTGAFIDQIVPGNNSGPGAGGLVGPLGLVFGPDANLYVGSNAGATGQILRYNGTSGAFIGSIFLGSNVVVRGLSFGPNGNLFVADSGNQRIVQVNGSTGVSMGTFASGAQLVNPEGVTFGPDGNLYVTSNGNNRIEKYNGTTGAYASDFDSPGLIGLGQPTGLTFSHAGDLYVSATGGSSAGGVLRYNGATGSLGGLFASTSSLNRPYGLSFGPDGNLYVSDSSNSQIIRFNGITGAFINDFVVSGPSTGPSWLVAPTYITFAPVPEPSSICLVAVGASIVAALRRRQFLRRRTVSSANGQCRESKPGADAPAALM